jgi:hypothetical protein
MILPTLSVQDLTAKVEWRLSVDEMAEGTRQDALLGRSTKPT